MHPCRGPMQGEGGGEQSSSDHPEWLERPGASEAVVVGADIRTRYSALQIEAGTKVDEVVINTGKLAFMFFSRITFLPCIFIIVYLQCVGLFCSFLRSRFFIYKSNT